MGRGYEDVRDELAPSALRGGAGRRGGPHPGRGARGDAARGLGPDPARAQAAGRGRARRAGRAGGDHGARLLQRQPAPGHQGRRPHRRARGAAHRQRAHRRLAGLRAAEAGRGHHRGLRPRRRHLRHLHPPRSRTASSRCSPPTATRISAATTSTGVLVDWLLEDIRAAPGGGPGRRRGVPQELRLAARGRQEPTVLRRATSCTIPFGDFVYRRDITRAELRGAASAVWWSARSAPAGWRSRDAGLTPADVDEVVLVGGSTRVPLVRRQVEALFGKTPHSQLNPDEVVALGRGGPGADSRRRHHRHAAARRHPAVARASRRWAAS